jgi:hypothetical protein
MPAIATAATWAAPSADPEFLSLVTRGASVVVLLTGAERVVDGKVLVVVLLEGMLVTMEARWRVRVWVRVKVLVEVVVVMPSATAASGRRRAAKMVARCILLKVIFCVTQYE